MAAYHLKLAGLADTDINTIKSMLRLSTKQLTHPWQYIDKGEAELVIYDLDSENGREAWGNRKNNLTAVLTIHGHAQQSVDITFYKPLRKTAFADSLNQAAQMLQTQATPQVQASATKNSKNKSSSGLLNKLLNKKTPSFDLPTLTLGEIIYSGRVEDTITDTDLLQSWLQQSQADTSLRTIKLLSNLSRLNNIKLKPKKRIELLESYRTAIRDLLSTHDSAAVKRDLYLTTNYLKIINSIRQLIEALTEGYKQIITHYCRRKEKPKANKNMLLCLIRVAETLSLSALHAYKYYRVVPTTLWQQLHELYLYLEKAQLLHEKVQDQNGQLSKSFYQIYLQIILTSLSDPYSLDKFEVLRLYEMTANFIDEVTIHQPSAKEIDSDNRFSLTGIYCIDCAQDKSPEPMYISPMEIRYAADSRVLNIQSLILTLDTDCKELAIKPYATLDLEQKLLLKFAPQLKTDGKRRYHRIKSDRHRPVTLAVGISEIYHCLSSGQHDQSTKWNIYSQSSDNIMAHHASEEFIPLSIGDFIGIFEHNSNIRLAITNWLQIDLNGETYIGLEYIKGQPTTATCLPVGTAEQHPALLLSAGSPIETYYIFTHKGIYSAKRKLHIKQDDKEAYFISADQLITSTMDDEMFSYKNHA